MASTRLLCLSYARAASWSKALARAGWRNVCTSPSRLQGCMSAWVIDQYGTNGVLKYTEEISIPTVSSPQEVMIEVHAASLNPLDVSMRGGYGAKLLKLRRDPLCVMGSDSEFPLILGRDVSGVVVDCGSEVTHFAPGDEVWAAVPPWKQGSLAEFVTLTEYELLKAWGANVTVTCSQNAEGLVRGLGADKVVDYTAGDAAEQLEIMEKFDVILDSVGGETEQWVMGKLKPWSGAKYVTLVTPLLHNTDSMGLLDGALSAVFTLNSKVTQNMISSGIFYRWGFYAPDGPALDEVSKLVDEGKILPVVEAQFPFTQVPQAFQKLEEGHARGKTVVRVAEEDDRQAEELVQNSRSETAAESEQEVPKTAKQH
ncbi:Reticulon-4-interacting protein 1, mitochondrial NOGO-interacting mitochondrial protein [Collichthys lucidus]|uniref:Reticulon-4-interacting protein 1, mitochondrial NOGO-interacting mitochondrial protein n=1 Tax=Collichthys lucidus TaxID=240159 RepID=A0A4U5ULF3_COLLU|nr:Reticulon-4-interacting protein 1, mitochondrial NOGO-interacting mitochondrial protein [Collichthys lucidus]